jgi:MoaA/NifB/PqqE/SkfB family radical SAM enzyme
MKPADYRDAARDLAPAVVQLSGGEPLTRPDLEDVARAVKTAGGPPLLICVTNGWLLNEERYLSLIEAGVDLFSISLDFPDERHDDFRRLRGLYAKLDDLVPRLAREHGRGDIALNTALTRANFAEIPSLVTRAEAWGVRISFSAYSALRTGERDLCITAPGDLALLARHVDFLLEHRRRSDTVLNSAWILRNTLRFFEAGGHLGGCRAGVRFLVVRPDGMMNGCSMFPDQRFSTREHVARGFTTRERCDECFVAIRAGTERPVVRLAIEGLATWRSLIGRRRRDQRMRHKRPDSLAVPPA